jgi:hypothetical protein
MNNYTFAALASILVFAAPLRSQNLFLLNQLDATKWETTYDAWQPTHPSAKCVASGANQQGADEQWCYRCTETSRAGMSEWSFYAFDSPDPPGCRLERFHATVAGPARTELNQIHQKIEAALTTRYGRPEDRVASPEFGSAFWQSVRHWLKPEREVYLYIYEQRAESPQLEVLARDRHLIAARAEDQQLSGVDAPQWPSGSPLDRRLIQELGAELPGLRALLAVEPPETKRTLQQQTLGQLLRAASTAGPERKAELLIAADRVANLLPDTRTPDPGSNERTENIAGFALHYRWSPLAAEWEYQHDLLRQVWREHPSTEWGAEAFLMLESIGWDTSAVCGKGTDQFRTVIGLGEKFLAEHPTNPRRVQVVFEIAQAYETWWSLSRAPSTDDYAQAENYRAGAGAARNKATAMYQLVLELTPQSPEAAYARRQLPRLKLGIDTGQRRFYCIYD